MEPLIDMLSYLATCIAAVMPNSLAAVDGDSVMTANDHDVQSLYRCCVSGRHGPKAQNMGCAVYRSLYRAIFMAYTFTWPTCSCKNCSVT